MKKVSLFVALVAMLAIAPVARAEKAITIEVTPTVSAAAAYTANDQVGGIQTLTNAALNSKGTIELVDVSVVDIDNQRAVLDIFFFDELPTITSSDNAAIAMSAANAKKSIGQVQVAAANYAQTAAQAVASLRDIAMLFTPKFTTPVVSTGFSARNIYAIAATRGTPTYTTTSSLVFRYKFRQY